MTEQTHPEAFGPAEASGDDEDFGEDEDLDGFSLEDGDAASAGAAGTARAIRRRGPLVTRWIGFSAQRRRARERSSRLRQDSGVTRSNA